MDYDCVVMVIDTHFNRHYGSVMEEVCHFFKILAQRLPFYLVFERQYEQGFHCWLRGTKRLYQLEHDVGKLQEAVRTIVETESKGIDPSGFMAP
ncbi:flagellar biosynthesis protein FlgL [Novimethylophilus kurashikiensis]|uniref:Flagellar biosynthesis protein FlgL n=2 Tax=Novimethylophilus kurashikiensis TaxID=1825523 RepID=A0A2R5F7K7_9PROT|nr:flagellar biosynthesis protein FlgL [Novimethylophilus kurashikiensis]